MRVVIDTNVFVSSFFGGKPKDVIDLWTGGAVTLCLSADILDEYVGVLRRLGVAQEDELADLLGLFATGRNCLFAARPPEIHVVERDRDDDKFFGCAVKLKARYIVSGDKAMLEVGNYCGIGVVTPKELLEAVKQEQ